MLDDEKLLRFIKEECNKLGITGYDIGKNTTISEQSAYKILNGITEKPRRKNLIQILEYLESKVLGTEINSKVEEPKEVYNKYTLHDCMKEKSDLLQQIIELNQHIFKLQNLLSKNNIKFDNYFERLKNEK